MADALDRHAGLSALLAQSLRELGDMRAQSLRAFSETWRSTSALGVTERRETCKEAAADFDYEIAKLTGEVEALRVELAHQELLIKYADSHADTR